jgi:hypothetical protein
MARGFVALAQSAAVHRGPEGFVLPDHVVLCLAENPRLMGDHSNPLVRLVETLVQAAGRDIDTMRACLRFREIGGRFVAWFAPVHHARASTGPFAGRFAGLPLSVLAPGLPPCWHGQVLLEGTVPTARRRPPKTSGRPTLRRSSIPRGSRFRPWSEPCRVAGGTTGPKPSALRRSLPAPRRGWQA